MAAELRRRLALAALLWTALWPLAQGHDVGHQVERSEATVLTLRYADGQPFADEAYELFAPGRAQPVQQGRTDAHGRAAFITGQAGRWRLRSLSDDGHGIDVGIEVDATGAPALVVEAPAPQGWRSLRAGLYVLAALGILSLALALRQWRQRRRAR